MQWLNFPFLLFLLLINLIFSDFFDKCFRRVKIIAQLVWLMQSYEIIFRNLLQTNQLCCGGKPGTNGIPGMHGIQGSPGCDGWDGRDGAKGDRGSPGRTGSKGPAGVEGEKGDPGVQGPAGQKGQRGEKGESGTPGSPQLASHMNWKECTWKDGDEKDQGLIRVGK